MFWTSREQAEMADRDDPLARMGERFLITDEEIYLDGNSLGALPATVPAAVTDAVQRQWGSDLIRSWNDNDWWTLPTRVGDRIGRLIGAAPGQVICGDSTSIQLFQALTAAARSRPGRRTIITDVANFPTDQYIADSVGELLGLDVIRTSPADVAIDDQTAVVAFSAVDYRTGQLWDLAGITARAHAAGAAIVWDLAHAAGALPITLDELGVDAAVGCSYKYLNGGPGAPAWLYLPFGVQAQARLPLTGWQGSRNPFELSGAYEPAAGIERARIGTAPLLSMLALEEALTVWDNVDLSDVRTKSLALGDLVLDRAEQLGIDSQTPRHHASRGSQVCLQLSQAYEICQALIARGVIGDFRSPNLLRLGLTPLYLSYVQVWDAMDVLADVIGSRSYTDPAYARSASAAVT